jgi:hypothetical protein
VRGICAKNGTGLHDGGSVTVCAVLAARTQPNPETIRVTVPPFVVEFRDLEPKDTVRIKVSLATGRVELGASRPTHECGGRRPSRSSG